MIAKDQPNCFDDKVLVGLSSREDGAMLDRSLDGRHSPEIIRNRRQFCAVAGIDYDTCVYQVIDYGSEQTHDVIKLVEKPNKNGISAEVLYTESAGIGLFLPVADCIATAIYDPCRHTLALAHLGRHASVAQTLAKTVSFFKQRGSNPADLIIWMSPSVAKTDYRMEYFDYLDEPEWRGFAIEREDGVYLDLAGYNAQLAEQAGVLSENIHMPAVATSPDGDYFSHSQGELSKRFAVVAMLR